MKKLSFVIRLFINKYFRKTTTKDYIRIKLKHRQNIRQKFKEAVKKTRSQLLEIYVALSEADQRGDDFESLKKKYYPKMEQVIISILEETSRLTERFSEKDHLYHKDFFRDQLGAFLLTSPFLHRSLMKPRGYAGDYHMMDMMCLEDPFIGHSSFGKLVQAVTYHLTSGRGVLERNRYSAQQMHAIGNASEKRFTLLNLACGSASDVQDFIQSSPAANRTEAYLVDQDGEALNVARERLGQAIEESKSRIKTHFHPINIQQLLKDKSSTTFPKFDLIYSGGLFDYIDDTAFSFILLNLFDRLNPGGTIIIGNFSPTDPGKIVRWYLSDWPLIYRTPKDLKRVGSILSKPKEMKVESSTSGVIHYLIIKK